MVLKVEKPILLKTGCCQGLRNELHDLGEKTGFPTLFRMKHIDWYMLRHRNTPMGLLFLRYVQEKQKLSLVNNMSFHNL